MKYTKVRLLALFTGLLLFCSFQMQGQRKNAAYEQYIKQYSDLAVEQQRKFKIPASITLAQALLESGAGLSTLAKNSNNHFGIKCHADWDGGRVYHDDDEVGECFRKYIKVIHSYDDHSLFLTKRPRYAGLFKLDIKDYKGWARGLQEYGYATDRAYANKLIKLIEDYELYRFDAVSGPRYMPRTESGQTVRLQRAVYKSYGLLYVVARENDSFAKIADDLGFKEKHLLKYNEVPEDFPLQKGDIVYLEKKKSKADKPHYDHVVQIGESMHSISQRYGMRMKSLYKLNKKAFDYIPEEGDVLKLR